jgi:hypothetical protein
MFSIPNRVNARFYEKDGHIVANTKNKSRVDAFTRDLDIHVLSVWEYSF